MSRLTHPLCFAGLTLALPVAAQPAAPALDAPPWFLHGLLEVEGSHADHDPFGGTTASDLTVATAALAREARVSSSLAARISTLYEEDATPLELDEATLTLSQASGLSLTLGQLYLPFGSFETHLVGDPFTLVLGETRESAAVLGYEAGSWSAAAFVFNGEVDSTADNRLDNGGVRLGYGGDGAWAVGCAYLADISDTDTVRGTLADAGVFRVAKDAPAHSAHFAFTHGPVSLLGEYLAAASFRPNDLVFDGEGAAPVAWNLEAGYSFELRNRPVTAAAGFQTREALALGLPAQRTAAGMAVGLLERARLAFEFARDTDYARYRGGTGVSRNLLTVQLAVEI